MPHAHIHVCNNCVHAFDEKHSCILPVMDNDKLGPCYLRNQANEDNELYITGGRQDVDFEGGSVVVS